MNILKCPHNPHHIRIPGIQVNPAQAFKLRVVGIASNVATGNNILVVIDCGQPVTEEHLRKVKQILG